jgi:hypothetical protein
MKLEFRRLPGRFAACRLPADAAIPEWAMSWSPAEEIAVFPDEDNRALLLHSRCTLLDILSFDSPKANCKL